MTQRSEGLRLGEHVRVARQDAERAKLAVCGYDLHEHFGDDGVVTGVVEAGDETRYVVRFDDYGRDVLPYRREELERLETA